MSKPAFHGLPGDNMIIAPGFEQAITELRIKSKVFVNKGRLRIQRQRCLEQVAVYGQLQAALLDFH